MYCNTWRAGAPLRPSIVVRLLHDLTEYHSGLRAGTEGVTVGGGQVGVLVRFPEAGVQDILSKSLEITDGDYLREREDATTKRFKALKTAHNVVLHLGPRGGFRWLEYTYAEDGKERRETLPYRDEAYDVLAVIKECDIPVEERRER